MIDGSTFIAFLAASAALILAPGPGQAMTVARTPGGVTGAVLVLLGLRLAIQERRGRQPPPIAGVPP